MLHLIFVGVKSLRSASILLAGEILALRIPNAGWFHCCQRKCCRSKDPGGRFANRPTAARNHHCYFFFHDNETTLLPSKKREGFIFGNPLISVFPIPTLLVLEEVLLHRGDGYLQSDQITRDIPGGRLESRLEDLEVPLQ